MARLATAALTCSEAATIRAGLPETWAICWGVYPGAIAFLTYGKQKQFASLSGRTERPRDLNGDIRETHVSAEPPCSQAPSRLSQAHADHRWSKGYCSPPIQRPQAPVGLTPGQGSCSHILSRAEAVIPILPTLKARAEFLAVRGGRRSSTPAFLIEMRERSITPKHGDGPRFGFTVTKKLGNAVTRNRIRRRLKAAFAAGASEAQASCDYVIVARRTALDRPYALLLEDVTRALAALHRSNKRAPPVEIRSTPRAADGKKGSA